MDLFLFELQKLVFNKTTCIGAAICLLLVVTGGIMNAVNLKHEVGDYTMFVAQLQEQEGPIDQQLGEQAVAEVTRLQALRASNPQAFAVEDPRYVTLQYVYANAYNMALNYTHGSERENPENPYSIAGLEQYLNRHAGHSDTFAYRNVERHLAMKQEAGVPGFFNTLVWDELLAFLGKGGALILALLIALVVSPVFAGEATSNMESLILSSKLGRRKIVTAKLLSTITFATLLVVGFFAVCLAAYFLPFGGLTGLDQPLNSIYSFHLSPFGGWSLLSYLLASVGLAWLVCVTLALVTAFTSATQKSPLPVIGITIALLLGPAFLKGLQSVLWPIVDFGFLRLLEGMPVFAYYKAYNLLGNPVLYPVVVVAVVSILSLILTCLTFACYRRKNASLGA